MLDYLEESGQLDNTIIVVISDNGASGEGGPNGSVNEAKFFNGYIDTVEDSMRFFDELVCRRRSTTIRSAGRWRSTRHTSRTSGTPA